MSTGIIFDLKRFAVHDGEGIRTTVFLKGCPLHCRWCHNPEGIKPLPEIAYHKTLCIKCHTCLEICPQVALKETAGYIERLSNCDNCRLCCDKCPTNALAAIGQTIEVKDLLELLKLDTVFYETSNGGITFSGGEPFEQAEFLLDCLIACKAAGLATALESCFYTDYSLIEKVLPYTDQFIIDIKLMNDADHQKYTGVSNTLILENIKRLADTSANILLRTPLIPQITDTKENLAAIAAFIYSLPRFIPHELLDYNPLAAAKYAMLQETYTLNL